MFRKSIQLTSRLEVYQLGKHALTNAHSGKRCLASGTHCTSASQQLKLIKRSSLEMLSKCEQHCVHSAWSKQAPIFWSVYFHFSLKPSKGKSFWHYGVIKIFRVTIFSWPQAIYKMHLQCGLACPVLRFKNWKIQNKDICVVSEYLLSYYLLLWVCFTRSQVCLMLKMYSKIRYKLKSGNKKKTKTKKQVMLCDRYWQVFRYWQVIKLLMWWWPALDQSVRTLRADGEFPVAWPYACKCMSWLGTRRPPVTCPLANF